MKVLLLLSLLFAGTAQGAGTTADYVVGSEDVLMISVVGAPEISNIKHTVGNDGAFDFPWIGRVAARGKTLRDLEVLIARRLEDGGFLVRPQVTVQVVEFNSQKVYVVGDVRVPGNYPLTGTTSIMDLITQAGGMLESAGSEILVSRWKSGVEGTDGPVTPDESDAEVFRVSKADVLSGRASRLVSLKNGDTINVPKGLAIFVSGQVKAPNRYTMDGKLTVLQAITLAGGPTERANAGRTRIIRTVDGRQKSFRVRLTDFVEPGDTVNVPARWW